MGVKDFNEQMQNTMCTAAHKLRVYPINCLIQKEIETNGNVYKLLTRSQMRWKEKGDKSYPPYEATIKNKKILLKKSF